MNVNKSTKFVGKPNVNVNKLDRKYWNVQCNVCGEWFTKKGLRIHKGIRGHTIRVDEQCSNCGRPSDSFVCKPTLNKKERNQCIRCAKLGWDSNKAGDKITKNEVIGLIEDWAVTDKIKLFKETGWFGKMVEVDAIYLQDLLVYLSELKKI